jgi:hypothetical protein
MFFEAKKGSAEVCETIFNKFDDVLGLKINWAETSAVLIGAETSP